MLRARAFVALEWLRGWLFTGFPWLTIGTSQVPGEPARGIRAVCGRLRDVAGRRRAPVRCSVALFVRRAWSRSRLAILVAIAAIFIVGAPRAAAPSGPSPRVRQSTSRCCRATSRRTSSGATTCAARRCTLYQEMIVAAPARVVVVPETALPAFLDQLPRDYVA